MILSYYAEASSQSEDIPISVSTIFKFISGKSKKPVLPSERNGFGITVEFRHCACTGNEICYPVVSTCSLYVKLPVPHMVTYNNFQSTMNVAIKHGMEFGRGWTLYSRPIEI